MAKTDVKSEDDDHGKHDFWLSMGAHITIMFVAVTWFFKLVGDIRNHASFLNIFLLILCILILINLFMGISSLFAEKREKN